MVDGFFEFHTEFDTRTGQEARKQPYFFHLPLEGNKQPEISVKPKGHTFAYGPCRLPIDCAGSQLSRLLSRLLAASHRCIVCLLLQTRTLTVRSL